MSTRIVEVWQSNLVEEVNAISELLERYPYIAIDTEFPGVVAEPVKTFKDPCEYRYQMLRCNVDMLKMIQLGFSFADVDGNLIPGSPTWQFNFRFSLRYDTYAQESINLLTESGIDFDRFERDGIDVEHFGELLISSGVVLNDSVKWISFHSCYDFAYLLKALTCESLPEDRRSFLDLVSCYFPNIYDMKYIASGTFRGGLNKLAAQYNVERFGQMHQAGSDSLVTQLTFFKLREAMGMSIEDDYNGKLFGIEEIVDGPPSPPRTREDSPKKIDNTKGSKVVNAPAAHELNDCVLPAPSPVYNSAQDQVQTLPDALYYPKMNMQEYVY
mmetsp:Transcript_9110/g.27409  ORF Transcript_9110/g.27409 Transcript_9110/m.27409 type:complete len:328 (-) Transcript_9110:116-1099(-)|eukprot:CAMPEP_0198722740 /NCGR_PEP_ID=MMETSP1475-20131203/365_1 /TAXON_ID= ORGANISM="Unidentified sp., Strain CCMP1999" /NCGR_SAMPLE_ID=MMETSP1475 /ASSEMBLY_ACC=CAM_ASM_001111 /LENGTH=327 /DNA_ID=CAMNT_0044483657 /DNA_START=120 /DNA_END=1103 /DNA_ORIENTATION=+